MNNFSERKENVRKYLLGTLDDEAVRRRIEESIMLTDEFEDQISIAEDELIEEYLDGELAAKEAESFETFFLASPFRREKLNLIKNLRRYSFEQKPDAEDVKKDQGGFLSFFLSQAFLRFAVAILLISGIGLIVWRTFIYESEVDKGLAQLNKAYQGTRPLESRSTIGLGYAAFTVTRGESSSPQPEQKSLDRAKIFLLDAAEDQTDAEAHHALGLLYLNEKQFDKALDEFNIALKISPDDAKLQSDAGAAFLEKAKQTESRENNGETMENLARSLQSIDRSLQLKPDLPEALFNKALVLEKMRQTNPAIEAWQKFLEIDAASQWANEARIHLEKLRQKPNQSNDKSQILKDFFDSYDDNDEERAWRIISQTKELITGAMIQQQLAKEFLEAERESRKEESDKFLSAFSYLGEIEQRKTGDRYFSDLARFYAAASAEQKEKLLQAHLNLVEGYKLIDSEKLHEAVAAFESSRKMFTEAGDEAESFIADYQIAYCFSQIGKLNESNRILHDSLARTGEQKYWLKALFYGWLGSNYSGLGEFSKAIAYDKKSLETAQKISDTYNIQRSMNQLANEYRRIRNRSETFNYCFLGIVNSENYYYQSPRQQFRNLYFSSQTLIESGFFAAALAVSQENLNLVENILKDNWRKHNVTVQMATIDGKTGKYQDSYDKFQKSIETASAIAEQTKVEQLISRSYLSLANMQRENDKCAEARENYDRALSIYRTMQFSVNVYEAEKGRLLCDVKQNDENAVREKMPEIIKSFDEYRSKLKEDDRTAFFNVEQTVYDTAIGYFYANLNDPVAAFNYSENSRSRVLLSLMKSGESQQSRTLSLDEIRASLPDKVQIVYYTVLPDRILIWHISKNSVESYEKVIGQKKLFEMVAEYRNSITAKSDEEKVRQLSKGLYDVLINPVKFDLEADSTICFIADKSLFQLPFSSLVSPASGRHLIEDFSIMLTPGATVFIEQTAIAKQKNQAGEEKVLSIGNPSFSRKEYPELSDLPSAEAEASRVGSLYTNKENILLVGKQAAKSAVSDELKTAEIVHFAGHYVPNFKSASLSKFLLAAGSAEDSDSALTVKEIIDRKLPRTKLIVLSACETGIEKFYNGEGMIGAARAFLAADVPLVVASQWSVDSDSTAELMVKFHNYRKRENLTTVEALRRAQIDMLYDEKSRFQQPYYWSGFSPIGGYAEY